MKNLLVTSVLALSLISFQSNAQSNKTESKQEVVSNTNQQGLTTIQFKITGITCAGCSSTIYSALEKVEGVIEHSVEYPGDIAIIQFDSSITSVEALKNAIEKKGYKAKLIKNKA
ncbi:MAG: heavy-metal-associated domain-containing protein [Bacteroidetes bacterium]|nr:heavy-metal-associated domain-containing protein [Bacteroidota bacterium]